MVLFYICIHLYRSGIGNSFTLGQMYGLDCAERRKKMLKEINPKFNRSVKARKIGEKGLGTLFLIFVMVLLVGLGFVVMYPVFTTLSLAFRPAREMFDETVIWIPKEPTLNNFLRAAEDLDYFHLVFKTVAVSLVCTLFSIISIRTYYFCWWSLQLSCPRKRLRYLCL